jgi:ABC-type Zn uptake system ZnuABC Zn-binding protein ZnuA
MKGSNDIWRRMATAALLVAAACLGGRAKVARCETEPLRVFATIPDLGDLAREVGGEEVSVDVMGKGREDAHFLEAKPSFIKGLSEADLYIQAGMDLEVGYAALLLQSARNPRVLPGNPGYLDTSVAITPLEVPAGPVDRSMGDVHPYGNPHYLLDPINGLKVARLIRDRLAQLRPDQREYFEERYSRFRGRLSIACVGEALTAKYDPEKLALLLEHGKLEAFVQGQGDQLGGWLAVMAPLRGSRVVDDHNLWPYFARRFGVEVIGHLEPKPGIPPTTSHLAELVERMRAIGVRAIIASPYYDPRHARFLSQATGASVVPLAHQVGSVKGADSYVATIDHNVRQLAAALGA